MSNIKKRYYEDNNWGETSPDDVVPDIFGFKITVQEDKGKVFALVNIKHAQTVNHEAINSKILANTEAWVRTLRSLAWHFPEAVAILATRRIGPYDRYIALLKDGAIAQDPNSQDNLALGLVWWRADLGSPKHLAPVPVSTQLSPAARGNLLNLIEKKVPVSVAAIRTQTHCQICQSLSRVGGVNVCGLCYARCGVRCYDAHRQPTPCLECLFGPCTCEKEKLAICLHCRMSCGDCRRALRQSRYDPQTMCFRHNELNTIRKHGME